VVDAAAKPTPECCDWASKRLGVILDSYTVYLDLWVVGLDGRVLANGRPRQYSVASRDVSAKDWFRRALQTASGADFVACDIERCSEFGGSPVATYATAIRAGGEVNGRPTGVLGIFFDWEKQSQAVVDSVRLADDEKGTTDCMLLSSDWRIIASTARDDFQKSFPLHTDGKKMGSYVDSSGDLIGFALTPGYETYAGLGWYGAIVQRRSAG
jgi:hypothetical protein